MYKNIKSAWNDFLKDGTVNSYLNYVKAKSNNKDVTYASKGKGSCDKGE